MKQALYTLVDSLEYVKTNCYQHQLSEALEQAFDVRYFTVQNLDLSSVPPHAPVLSRLKLRTLDTNLGRVREALNGRPLMVYEQDPWENFMVDAAYHGAYKRIWNALNVSTFLNISHWWRDRVIEDGMRSTFVQVWTLPRYCRPAPVPWAHRKYGAVFCGTMYPRRKEFFDRLESLGVKVEVLPSGYSYPDYLNLIAHAKVAVRSERVNWTLSVAGQVTTTQTANALWKRDIETAAQGCFSLRDWDLEKDSWNISSIPSIDSFDSVEEAADKCRQILTLSPEEADARALQGINYVRSAPGWNVTCDVIRGIIS